MSFPRYSTYKDSGVKWLGDSHDAHSSMTKQVLNSPELQKKLLDVLLNHARL